MFKKAERRQAKLKIALAGVSGSGKTYSSLLLAKGIANGGKVALIDTENNSASLYSDRFEFDVVCLSPPYTLQKYQDAIKSAVSAKYDVLIVDSISHQWAGEGGLLDKKAKMDQGGGNSFTNWGKLTPEQEKFKSLILQAEVHMICTMRSKQEYALQSNDKGKTEVKKLGLAPIQRDGMEYEFTTMFDIDTAHSASTSKDRTGLWDGQIFTITEDTGKTFITWLDGAKPAEAQKEVVATQSTDKTHYQNLVELASEHGLEKKQVQEWLSSMGIIKPGMVTDKVYDAAIRYFSVMYPTSSTSVPESNPAVGDFDFEGAPA